MVPDASSSLYGVVGCPIKHSKSPTFFNRAFAEKNINAVFLAFEVEPEHVQQVVRSMTALKVMGLAVTLPHKRAAFEALRGWGGEFDSAAMETGVVNTIANRNGVLKGYNVDGEAALQALEEKKPNANWSAETILILGSGSTARSFCSTLAARKTAARIDFLVRRKTTRALLLAADMRRRGIQSDCLLEAEFAGQNPPNYNLIVNATPVGMFPNPQKSPFRKEWIRPKMFGYDLIYNPSKTMFLKQFEASALKCMNGEGMFIRQARMQFELWTGKALALGDAERLLNP